MNKSQRNYAQDIADRIERIERYTGDGLEAFKASDMKQDAIIRNFEVIGEAAKKLLPETIAPYPQVPWKRIAGFRDVLIHNYDSVRLEIVWSAIK
jgi:uncharacterized protein with HEPN domain